mmetsp:Transcript_78772/g.231113  ORF Transcript_78772/g.231113 Transcript_78772/m.231113 type:complete len:351 (+) Transcript_78772:31-1083(+)
MLPEHATNAKSSDAVPRRSFLNGSHQTDAQKKDRQGQLPEKSSGAPVTEVLQSGSHARVGGSSHGVDEGGELRSLLLELLCGQHLVNQSVVHGLRWRHVVAPVRVLDHVLVRLSDRRCQEVGHRGAVLQHLLRHDADVRGLPGTPRGRLPGLREHDGGVRQREALALAPKAQEHGRRAIGLTNGDGLHLGLDVLHAVANGKGVRLHAHLRLAHVAGVVLDGRACAVDVHGHRLVCRLVVEVEQLGDDQLRHLVGDWTAEVDDAVLQEQGGKVRRWSDWRTLIGLRRRGVGRQGDARLLATHSLTCYSGTSTDCQRCKDCQRRCQTSRQGPSSCSGCLPAAVLAACLTLHC